MELKWLSTVCLILCILVSGCGQALPAEPLTVCFSAELTVTDENITWQGRLTVTEGTFEWILTAPPEAAGYTLCCDGENVTLVAEEGEPLTAAIGILPGEGIPVVLWCALFDSDRQPPSWDGSDGLSTGYTPEGVYELRTDGGTGLPLGLRPVGGNWSAVFEKCTSAA